MFKNIYFKQILIIGLGLIFTLCSTESFARGQIRRPPVRVAPYPPAGHRPLVFGGVNYFFHGGIFFRIGPSGYFAVKAPVGLVVASLPVGVEIVFIGGETYYYHSGVYYREVPEGYVVVEKPKTVIVEKAPEEDQEEIVVTNKVLVTTAILNVRSGPGKNHPVVCEVHKGDTLIIQGNAPGWLYVELPDGKYGWIVEEYTEPVVPPPAG
jgi:hypothetical protein